MAYALPARKDRELQAFQTRDGEPALRLTAALAKHGYEFEDTIINYPPSDDTPIPLNKSDFREDDLILLCTRPPMHDTAGGEKKYISRSSTMLEKALFSGTLRHVFTRCERSEIQLTDLIAGISDPIALRRVMFFYQHGGAGYRQYGSPRTGEWVTFKKGGSTTAAFLVYVEHAWPGGPAFMVAFGVGGNETLAWASLLKTRFADLLCTTSFAMVEMRSNAPRKPQPRDLVASFDVELLGKAPLSLLRDRGAPPTEPPTRPVGRGTDPVTASSRNLTDADVCE